VTVWSELLRENVDGADSPDAVPAWAQREEEILECWSACLKDSRRFAQVRKR